MNDNKLNLTEFVGIGSTLALLSSIAYVYSFNNALGHNIMKYFTISDYLNFSAVALLPLAIGMAFGIGFRQISDEVIGRESEKKKVDKVLIKLYMFSFFLVTILSGFKIIPRGFSSILIVSIMLLLLIKLDEDDIKTILSINRISLIRIVVLLLVCVVMIGSVNGNSVLNKANNTDVEKIVLDNKIEYNGKILFNLTNFIIFIDENNEKISVIPLDKISNIELKH